MEVLVIFVCVIQGGVYIVDSPGIGESREMTEMVKSYLPSAFSFIYVINSSNAGGLQPDRVSIWSVKTFSPYMLMLLNTSATCTITRSVYRDQSNVYQAYNINTIQLMMEWIYVELI